MDKQIDKEIKDGTIMDPVEIQQLQLGVHPEQMGNESTRSKHG